MSGYRFCIISLFFIFMSFRAGISFADATTIDTSDMQSDAGNIEKTGSEIWKFLLQSRLGELQAINQEVSLLFEQLPILSQKLSQDVSVIERGYQQYSAMAKVSRGLPIELSLAEERLKKLNRDLTIVMSPLVDTLSVLKARLNEVSLLEQAASVKTEAAQASKELQTFVYSLDQVERRLGRLENRLKNILTPAELLRKNIKVIQTQLAKVIPNLWKSYYLVPSGKLYDLSSWSKIHESLKSLKETFFLRIEAELPEGKGDWWSVLLQFLVMLVPMLIFIGGTYRLSRRWPEALKDAWHRLSKKDFLLLYAGIAFHFSAWAPSGENYYILSILGTSFMSIGQVGFAWSLYNSDIPDQKGYSPFWKLLIPLLGGILVLLLNFSGLMFNLLWIGVLLLSFYQDHKHSTSENVCPLVVNLLKLHVVVLWIALIMTILGWAKLSILFCMSYSALAVCIQQSIGIIRVSNLISQNMPQEGFHGLFSGMLLALILPTILIISIFATGLWILAYPGGAFLISHLTQLDFSIGMVTFSLAQVLLLVSAFYVTRSFASVGRMFIASLVAHNIHMEKSIVSPIQTGFTYAIWAIFAFSTLYFLGVSLTSLAVVAGGLSVGIGFGLQNIANNFISGLLMIFGQTLREGDVIEVGNNLTGVVRKINIRSTQVETFDNATIFVPNAEFLSGRLTNWTRNGRSVRRQIVVGVAYGSDVEMVIRLLKQIADEHPKVLRYPASFVVFDDFGSSSLNFILRFWVGDIAQALDITSELRVAITKTFTEKNIDIAFPQLDIHVCDDSVLTVKAVPELPKKASSAKSLKQLKPIDKEKTL